MQPISPSQLSQLAPNKWGSNSISYSFYIGQPAHWTEPNVDFAFGTSIRLDDMSPITTEQWIAFQQAVSAWSAVANISLQEAAIGMGDIFVGRVPFETSRNAPRDPGAQAVTIPLGFNAPGFDQNHRGDIWFSTRPYMEPAYMDPGASGYTSVLHELGHALGLTDVAGLLPQQQDSHRYSVMSYLNLQGTPGPVKSGAPVAPMIADIAAIQYLYGANASTHNGDDVYRFEIRNGWPVQAIWDAGGVDTIDASDQSRELIIDLNPGGESYGSSFFAGRGAEIHVALTPISRSNNLPDPTYAANFIENAVGGSQDDAIIGNEAKCTDKVGNCNGDPGCSVALRCLTSCPKQ